ncbi:hypothetical protein TBLA_0D01450 [Henningerozyma blattae CBS 6284]|uniref:Uracil-DNA glycosylase n=1 Tax=Henningerozyma blattae (strain ATCC 34711 / CBS 6284 / DSM 70876 / NBRC 10599 / NRRL Y-10934 / UCD 77-7) TaxID=1071380 RepID=I2H2Q0_HENB6|nr:hypothetical protein TBLA_0D01450 [Tetrapisispora blattae CBS 6284]CCH60652.1 hypothetical protein TBLA_0D01450 [Tetrapisispora blattae CBS 6284]
MTTTKNTKKRQITISEFFGPKESKKVKTEKHTKTSAQNLDSKNNENEKNSKRKSGINLPKKNYFRTPLEPNVSNLLELELTTLDNSWFTRLEDEIKKPYFIKLKEFLLRSQKQSIIFPPPGDIYSWSRLTPFDKVNVVIIGQDPYHNHNQAHGLAFSVKKPTPAPPSLKNIYKELQKNYNGFVIDNKFGDLTPWAKQGVLLLNTTLTVMAHNANSHSKQGWDIFTRRVVELLIEDREKNNRGLCFLLWGSNAIKLVENILKSSKTNKLRNHNIKIFKSVHPSPLSASRGFFGNNHFKQINSWLYDEQHLPMIDWSVVPDTKLLEVEKANAELRNPTK